MKKAIILFGCFLIFQIVKSQEAEIGYRTTDVGGEYLTYADGSVIGLHIASNARLNHSFQAFLGYYMAKDNTPSYYYNSTKGGLGIGIGYRYYTKPRPDGFFIGIKANLFTNKIILSSQPSDGPYTSMIFIPAFQTGYMFLINDMFFITPSVGVGLKTNLQNKLTTDKKKTIVMPGISCGFKF